MLGAFRFMANNSCVLVFEPWRSQKARGKESRTHQGFFFLATVLLRMPERARTECRGYDTDRILFNRQSDSTPSRLKRQRNYEKSYSQFTARAQPGAGRESQ